MSDELPARMALRTDDELRAICTTDASDYTAEALSAARDELARRGHDVASLAPAASKPVDRDAERFRLGASAFIAALVIAMFAAPFIGDAPRWVQIVFTGGLGALASVGVAGMFRPRTTG